MVEIINEQEIIRIGNSNEISLEDFNKVLNYIYTLFQQNNFEKLKLIKFEGRKKIKTNISINSRYEKKTNVQLISSFIQDPIFSFFFDEKNYLHLIFESITEGYGRVEIVGNKKEITINKGPGRNSVDINFFSKNFNSYYSTLFHLTEN